MKKQIFILFILLANCLLHAQIKGCTDPLGKNYNPVATVNDGSCEYKQASVVPIASIDISARVGEASGLVIFNDTLYTHNDNTDVNLYALDSGAGTIFKTLSITGSTNKDWEELAQDNDYFYIGDFGNNVHGNRTDLHILKINKHLLSVGKTDVQQINFSYSNQTDFRDNSNNATNFDCEAMVICNDSIYLFSKQWEAKKTTVYALSKMAGNHVARLKATHDVNGLITGATYLEDKNLIVLCGYSNLVSPFLYLLYDFKGHDFFSGNKRKINLSGMSFHQTEGVATENGFDYYVINEHFAQRPFINVKQKMHRFDLTSFLGKYFEKILTGF